MDDLYNAFVRGPVVRGSDGCSGDGFDAGLIDGAVNGSAALATDFAARVRLVQSGSCAPTRSRSWGGRWPLLGYLLWR